jgi:hypothetical protein
MCIITIYNLPIIGIHPGINKKDEQHKIVSILVISHSHSVYFKFECNTKMIVHRYPARVIAGYFVCTKSNVNN